MLPRQQAHHPLHPRDGRVADRREPQPLLRHKAGRRGGRLVATRHSAFRPPTSFAYVSPQFRCPAIRRATWSTSLSTVGAEEIRRTDGRAVVGSGTSRTAKDGSSGGTSTPSVTVLLSAQAACAITLAEQKPALRAVSNVTKTHAKRALLAFMPPHRTPRREVAHILRRPPALARRLSAW